MPLEDFHVVANDKPTDPVRPDKRLQSFVAGKELPGIALMISGRPHFIEIGVSYDAIAGKNIRPVRCRNLHPLRSERMRVGGEMQSNSWRDFKCSVDERD